MPPRSYLCPELIVQVQREESESGKGSPRVFVMGKHIESMRHALRAPGALDEVS